MKKSSIFVGLDVHKNSIEIAIAEAGRNGEVRSYGKIDGSLGALDKVIRKLVSKGYELHFVYEAGPCGYEIYRHLAAQGFDCMVVAPAMIPKQSGNRIKNDHRDAQMLARLHRAGELSAVFVPFAEDEAMRDLTRSREDAKLAEKKGQAAHFGFSSPARSPLQRAKPLEPGAFALDRRNQNASSGPTDRPSGICGRIH
jgi:transposase